MARTHEGGRADVRANALWGTGNRGGDHRSNALWGRRGRGLVTTTIAALSLALPMAAAADEGRNGGRSYVAPGVYQAAEKHDSVQVIIQMRDGDATETIRGFGYLKQELSSIGAVVAEIPSKHLDKLTEQEGLVVTLDAPVRVSSYSATQLWPHQNGASKYWGSASSPGPTPPTIAIVDSGLDVAAGSFGNRVTRQKIGSFAQDGGTLDGRGHGTFVAGIAAGSAVDYAGVSPRANLIDLDVMDDQGMARTSDVIAACDWILANKASRNIRVANFSLHSSSVLSIRYHPLNKAVEKLWLNGVVVVAAAGNYGKPDGPSGVVHAPGNDPFVITVGAYDLDGTAGLGKHDVPSWSAYGYTNEGFAKPDVVAAGRYLVAPAPAEATIGIEKPERIVAPGFLKLSGTSFAAPVVTGMAAQILAHNPGMSPDQVKGALMKTGRRMPGASLLEQGRGEVNLVRAIGTGTNVPNPNAGLLKFVVSESSGSGSGLKAFDAAAWQNATRNDAAWDSAAWSSSAWSDAAWNDAAWNDAAWSSAAWNDAAWNDSAWADSAAYEDNVAGEPNGTPDLLTPSEQQALASDPALNP